MLLPSIARACIQNIQPYQQGKPIEQVQRELGLSDIVKLASNESAVGPSQGAVAAMTRALSDVHLYPDMGNFRLKQQLGEAIGVTPDHLVFGAGSSTVIRLLSDAFLEPGDEVIYPHPSFILYEYTTHLGGATPVKVPLDAEHRHDLDAMAKAVTDRTKLIFICNPNNPTGNAITRTELDAFLEKVPERVLVVLDEAYYEYAAGPEHPDGLEYVRAGRNVLVLRTFSKVYGLAGLRVGYGVGQPEVVAALRRVREPFNVSAIAQAAVLGALADKEHVARSRAVNDEGIATVTRAAQEMGLTYIPTKANFVAIQCPEGLSDLDLFSALQAQGIIVRPGRAFAMPGWIRVTFGTPEQNQRFLTALASAIRVSV